MKEEKEVNKEDKEVEEEENEKIKEEKSGDGNKREVVKK